MKAFVEEFKKGTFTTDINVNAPAASIPQTVEEFEESWEEWKRLLRNIYNDKDDNRYPSRGALASDKKTDECRAVSDGNGGLIYIDGSESDKYPRFEDLSPEEQNELYLTTKKLNGSLAKLDSVLRRMEEHGRIQQAND